MPSYRADPKRNFAINMPVRSKTASRAVCDSHHFLRRATRHDFTLRINYTWSRPNCCKMPMVELPHYHLFLNLYSVS